MPDEILGYRLEWKPGDPCYMTPEHYALEGYKDSALVHGLYATPQPGCPAQIEVYKGWCWVQPKYNFGNLVDATFRPLYVGALIHCPTYDEAVLLAFPGIVEQMVKASRPDLFQAHPDHKDGGAVYG
ncbi:hypothetical protein LMG26685_02927 [Achromobacter mucicolens]|uniref:hypothetical protein n=1 Tax=Achromobacter mucicolens TaxID=1389922 RepID=UPI0009C71F98|nr:hypothetical protein [Achromobacter mucicolens]OXC90997.1 hypothetical protein BMR85_007295 [Achromobacter sp. KAs 3-5]CAB3654489.1 hypothetical protein LMG26685_02927 [Achromobacter mucicolens]